jgi:hypothetical protein
LKEKMMDDDLRRVGGSHDEGDELERDESY